MKNCILICIMLLLHITTVKSEIRYVKEGATGNGSSWDDASGDIQEMINISSPNDQIWVAAGTYKPNRKANSTGIITLKDRNNAFVLRDSIKVLGGFYGNEVGISQRNWTENITILSGDLSGDDIENDLSSNKLDNSYHVVISLNNSKNTELDGFIISGGYGAHTNINVNGYTIYGENGAGIYIINSSVILKNLIITNNVAIGNSSSSNAKFGGGGGIFCNGNNSTFTSPELINVKITNNSCNNMGGGICNIRGATPSLTDVEISDNISKNRGGAGLFNNNSSPILKRVNIRNNNAKTESGFGGGVHNEENASPVFDSVLITENIANAFGGGMYNKGASPIVKNVIISNNISEGAGGGMHNRDGAFPILINVKIVGNFASGHSSQGGGICNRNNVNLYIINSLISGNKCGLSGGGIYIHNGEITLINSTIVANCLDDNNGQGPGIYINSSYSYIYNNIFNRNGGGNPAFNENAYASGISVPFMHCIIGGDFNTVGTIILDNSNVEGPFNLFIDPVDHYNAPTDQGIFKLRNACKAINKGNDSYYDISHTELDLDGLPRFIDEIDIGAYEFQGDPLPIELISFYSECNNNYIAIKWETATEINNDYFILERSNDLTTFTEIAKIKGAGFSNEIKQYNITDDLLVHKHIYYRLKQYDYDGTETIYKAIHLKCDENITFEQDINIFPNPFYEEINIELINIKNDHLLIEIFDESGKQIFSKDYDSEINNIVISELNNLCPSIYYLNLITSDIILNKKIIKGESKKQ